MALIPLYILGPNPPLEPYIAYDLIVDYPPIDIEPLPGVPKIGGVVRSYHYALWYHTQINDDALKEKAKTPINIKRKSQLIAEINKNNPITQNDHLSLKNSYFLAGNTDLILSPDVGEYQVTPAAVNTSSNSMYAVLNYENYLLYEDQNPANMSWFNLPTISLLDANASPVNVKHYIIVSSTQNVISVNDNSSTLPDMLRNLLENHSITIRDWDGTIHDNIIVTRLHFFFLL